MLDPNIWRNHKFGYLSTIARLLFIGMITLADDEGRLQALPRFLKASIFPYDDVKEDDIISALQECLDTQLVQHYKNGLYEYCVLFGWEEHQTIRRDLFKKSTIPEPPALQPRNVTVTPALQPRNVTVTPALLNKETNKVNKQIKIINKEQQNIYQFYESNFELLRPYNSEELKDLENTYNHDKVLEALKIAVKAGNRNLRYVEGVLKKEGAKDEQPPTARRKNPIKRVTESSLRAAELAKRKNQ